MVPPVTTYAFNPLPLTAMWSHPWHCTHCFLRGRQPGCLWLLTNCMASSGSVWEFIWYLHQEEHCWVIELHTLRVMKWCQVTPPPHPCVSVSNTRTPEVPAPHPLKLLTLSHHLIFPSQVIDISLLCWFLFILLQMILSFFSLCVDLFDVLFYKLPVHTHCPFFNWGFCLLLCGVQEFPL